MGKPKRTEPDPGEAGPGKSYRALSDAGRGLSLAFEFVGAVVLFWLVGRFIDGRLGTDPWAQVAGSVVGWVGGFLHVYYATRPGAQRAEGNK